MMERLEFLKKMALGMLAGVFGTRGGKVEAQNLAQNEHVREFNEIDRSWYVNEGEKHGFRREYRIDGDLPVSFDAPNRDLHDLFRGTDANVAVTSRVDMQEVWESPLSPEYRRSQQPRYIRGRVETEIVITGKMNQAQHDWIESTGAQLVYVEWGNQ